MSYRPGLSVRPSVTIQSPEALQRVLVTWGQSAPTRPPSEDLSATPLALGSWSKHFSTPSTLVLALDRDADVSVLLPLVRQDPNALGAGIRTLKSLGNFYWQFGYPISQSGTIHGMDELLSRTVVRPDWDVLELGPMLVESEQFRALHRSGERLGACPTVDMVQPDPIVRIEGTWDDYYHVVSKGLRDKVEQAERRLMRQGHLSFEVCHGGPSLVDELRDFFELEAAGWKGRQRTAIANDQKVQAFYTDLAREAASRSCLRLYSCRLNGKLIAADFAILQDRILYLLKIAYAESMKRFSPGHLLRRHVLRGMFETKEAEIYDLMRGGGEHAAYKQRWANANRRYAILRLYHPTTIRGKVARALAGSRRWVRKLRGSRPIQVGTT